MAAGPWPTPFVGSHMYLPEPSIKGTPEGQIPEVWSNIRFDAIDVLFVSPFFASTTDHTFQLGNPGGGQSWLDRFRWVIQAARTANPNVKIILMQFYGANDQGQAGFDEAVGNDSAQIQAYADSVAEVLESWYGTTLPSLNGDGEVSATLDGWDVDVESDTLVEWLPAILTAVRASLDQLSSKLGAPRFSTSITPAWTQYLDASVAQSVDYINMQNYDGGFSTSPHDYKKAIPGLKTSQLVWGICSETPTLNTLQTFARVKAKADAVVAGQPPGIYTWRLNSSNILFENAFLVWLYDTVHVTTLSGSLPETEVAQWWTDGGSNTPPASPQASPQPPAQEMASL